MANYAQILQTLEQACVDFQVKYFRAQIRFFVILNPKNISIASIL